MTATDATHEAVAALLVRREWGTGHERAAALTALLGLPMPELAEAEADASRDAFCFERRIFFRHGDGSESRGRIDLYRLGACVPEAKDIKAPLGWLYDDTLRARARPRCMPGGRASHLRRGLGKCAPT